MLTFMLAALIQAANAAPVRDLPDDPMLRGLVLSRCLYLAELAGQADDAQSLISRLNEDQSVIVGSLRTQIEAGPNSSSSAYLLQQSDESVFAFWMGQQSQWVQERVDHRARSTRDEGQSNLSAQPDAARAFFGEFGCHEATLSAG